MITIKDIAREVGVSHTTVSLALNGKDRELRISAATRDKILETARRLGYEPNDIARSMVTGKARVLGLISAGVHLEYVTPAITGAMEEAYRHGRFIKLIPLSNVPRPEEIADQCVRQRLEGAICRGLKQNELEALRTALAPRNIPLAMFDLPFRPNWGVQAVSDDETGAFALIRRLAELGHRDIALIANAAAPPASFAARRLRAFDEAAAVARLTVRPQNRLAIEDKETLIAAVAAITRERPRPTALVCVSDLAAMLAARGVRRAGARVPEDVSLTGFANLSFSALMDPPLTTIAQDFMEMGRVAVERLLEASRERRDVYREPIVSMVPTRLIERESTAAPPAA